MNMGRLLYRNCSELVFLLLLTSCSTSTGFQFQTNNFFVGVKLLSLHHQQQQKQLPSSTIIRKSKSKLTTTKKNKSPSSSSSSSVVLHGIQPYGKGAEVWPEPSDEIIQLEDTFPLEQVALMKALYNENSNGDEVVKNNDMTENIVRKRDKILNLIQKSGVMTGDQNNMNNNINDDGEDKSNKFPIVVGMTLLCSGLVMPMDVLFTFGFSIYLKILHTWNRIAASTTSSMSSSMSSMKSVIVPSLPSQGHIPALVSNPLGNMFSNSPMYKNWLIIGAVLGLIVPSLYIAIFGVLQSNMKAAGYAARPLFLFCCQAITEAVSRKVLSPLPIRILIPIVYNSARLIPIWQWTFCTLNLGIPGRFLALCNLIYWSLNLFAFLLPVATMRYMRAHFFCVEASEVSLREAGESGAGLLPRL